MPRRSAADSYSNPPDIEAYELRRLAEAEQARIRAEAKIQARLEAPQAAQNDAEARERGRLRAQAEAAEERAADTLAELESVLGPITGPQPVTAQGWADRGERVLRLALRRDSGIDPTAARAYASECDRRAGWLDPAQFGNADALPPPPVQQADPVAIIKAIGELLRGEPALAAEYARVLEALPGPDTPPDSGTVQ